MIDRFAEELSKHGDIGKCAAKLKMTRGAADKMMARIRRDMGVPARD